MLVVSVASKHHQKERLIERCSISIPYFLKQYVYIYTLRGTRHPFHDVMTVQVTQPLTSDAILPTGDVVMPSGRGDEGKGREGKGAEGITSSEHTAFKVLYFTSLPHLPHSG